jgi:pantetheine-phosphate adenylyltransferase
MTNQSSKTALYAGSFHPFTVGHQDIAERALLLCDKLIIGIGVNPDKDTSHAEEDAAAIRRVMQSHANVEVMVYSGLTVDFAREQGVDFLVRGVRSVIDFEQEKTLADINRRLSGIETVLLTAKPELSYISSSMVRELEQHNVPISEFLAEH